MTGRLLEPKTGFAQPKSSAPNLVPSEEPWERGVAVWAAGPGDVYMVGAAGLVLRSDDGGEHWRKLRSGTRQDLCDVWGPEAGCVLLVGAGGLILSTRDRGGSFVSLDSGTGERLLGAGGCGERCCAVGAHGSLVLSEDGGRSWRAGDSGTADHLHACLVLEGGQVVAVGEHGAIVRSDDGATFHPVPVATRRHLLAIERWGDRVVAAGEAGTILISDDGGRRFEEVPARTTEALRALWGMGATMLAVGRGGVAVYSEDHGRSWVAEHLARRGDFSDLCAIGERDLLLAGPRGTLMFLAW